MTIQNSHAQSRETAFGLVREIPTHGTYDRLNVFGDNKDGIVRFLLWTHKSTTLTLAEFDSTLTAFRSRKLFLPLPIDDVMSADVNGDAKPDLIVVHRSVHRISLFTNLIPDSLKPVAVIQIPFDPANVVLGDINNDKRTDLLVFNRDEPGVLPFLGQGRGNLKQFPLIAPDIAVGNLTLVQLNNDNLMDLVLYDWVESDLHLLYGVGQGKFIDQTTFPVEGEVRDLRGEEMTKSRIPNFVLSYKNPPQLQLWTGDGLGYFRPTSTTKLRNVATSLVVDEVNQDGWKDVILLSSAGALQVHLGLGEEFSPDYLEFAVPPDSRQVIVKDLNEDKKVDGALLDREGEKLLIYFNARQSNILNDSLTFVTGLRPTGIALRDLNGDGKQDVALVNAASNSLSIFFGRGEQGLIGQTTFLLSGSPKFVDVHSATDSTVRLLISYPLESSISLLNLNFRENSSVSANIPTVGESELLYSVHRINEHADFFVYNGVAPTVTPSLTFFQQLGPTTFIERSFRLTIPDALLGAAVQDLNGDGFVDVIYAYRNSSTAKYELAVSLGDSTMSFRRRVYSYTLPDSVLRKSYFWISDFDGDGKLDLLFLFPLTSKKLSLARGFGDGTFAEPIVIAEPISVTDRAQLQVLDLDGDGKPDIAINESERGSLGWLKGKGDFLFEEWSTLVNPAKIGHFAFGDLDDDGVRDLVVSLIDQGRMRVYNGRLFFKILTQQFEN